MSPCVETTVEAQQSPPTPGLHCLPNPTAPPAKRQGPRALRCSSQCLARDPGIKHQHLVVPCFSVQPITSIKDYEICWSSWKFISSVQVNKIDFLCHKRVSVKAALCSVYCPELRCWPLQLTQTVTREEPDWTGVVGECSHSFSWCRDDLRHALWFQGQSW